jgi:aminopeptidase N
MFREEDRNGLFVLFPSKVGWIVRSFAALCAVMFAVFTHAASTIDALHYDVKLEPDMGAQRLSGHVAIRFQFTTQYAALSNTNVVELDAGELEITSVKEGKQRLSYSKEGKRLSITMPKRARDKRERTIQIAFNGKPKFGLRFLPEAEQTFTEFSTSEWMPCVDAPSDRASVSLTLDLPRRYKVVANGDLQSRTNLPNGKARYVWRQTPPIPSYLFGFAAGVFREVIDDSMRPTLRYLTSTTFDDADIKKIFKETRSMIAFFEKKAGIQYPDRQYTQVLVSGRAAQEIGGFAVIGESYGQRALIDERAVWLGAHEVAHQWWGNAITNESWNEFWLNEGIGSFMTAAYLEDRFGREAYDRFLNASRTKYNAVRDAGKDKSLVFDNWLNPTSQDRSLVYDKGFIATHELRELLGDDVFWSAFRDYTKKYWNRSVTTQDLQQSMEASSGRSLTAFFNEWVYFRK